MKNKALWTLQIVGALAFLAAGSAKLLGVPMMIETFDKVGVGQWFRYVTAVLEIAGAVALLTPRFSGFGAALLTAVMIGAIAAHLFLIGGSAIPAIVLLAIALTIVSQRLKPQVGMIAAAA